MPKRKTDKLKCWVVRGLPSERVIWYHYTAPGRIWRDPQIQHLYVIERCKGNHRIPEKQGPNYYAET